MISRYFSSINNDLQHWRRKPSLTEEVLDFPTLSAFFGQAVINTVNISVSQVASDLRMHVPSRLKLPLPVCSKRANKL